MKGTTPKTRARELNKILKATYDEHGKEANIVDMLTDLRHVCDAKEWDFGKLDKTAYEHYLVERRAKP